MMDAIARALKDSLVACQDECATAGEDTLLAWAAEDTIRSLFAKAELVYRDQRAFIDAVPLGAIRNA